jgi:hypothetical protein
VGGTSWFVKKPPVIEHRHLLWENFLGSFSFCMFRSEITRKIGLLDESLPSSQDRDYWLRITGKYSAGVLPEYLAIQHDLAPGRITLDAGAKETGLAAILSKYRGQMTDECQRHVLKYLFYYKTFSASSFRERTKNFNKLRGYSTRNRTDRARVMFTLVSILLPVFNPWKIQSMIIRLFHRNRVIEENRAVYRSVPPDTF